MAMRDFLSGPEGAVRGAADRPRRGAGDPRGVPGRHGAPRRRRAAPLADGRPRVAAVAEAAGGQGRPGRGPRPRARATSCAPSTRDALERPQRDVPAEHGQWFMLSRLDGATVTTSDGSGVTFRKRDREMFWSMLRESVALHAEIAKAWPAARRRYQDAMGELVSRRPGASRSSTASAEPVPGYQPGGHADVQRQEIPHLGEGEFWEADRTCPPGCSSVVLIRDDEEGRPPMTITATQETADDQHRRRRARPTSSPSWRRPGTGSSSPPATSPTSRPRPGRRSRSSASGG